MSATEGSWDGVLGAPGNAFAVHAALLNNGDVLLFSGIAEGGGFAEETYQWDPTQPISTAETASMPVDLFCAHHVTLEDGRVLTVGGSGELDSNGRYVGDWGISAICVYDREKPLASRWDKIGDLDSVRWYPTCITLANGDVLVISGISKGSTHVSMAELLSPPFEGPSYAPSTVTGGPKSFPSYPGMLMVKGGKVFHCATTWQYRGSGTTAPIGTFSFAKTGASSGTWVDEGISPEVDHREEAAFVLLPPAQDGRILVVGGGFYQDPPEAHHSDADLDSAEILDTQGTPSWSRIDDMSFPRVNPTTVLLPDATVLVIGGHDSYKWSGSLTPSNRAEVYDPVLDTWTTVAQMGAQRIYHSSALLLPDGRVLAAGGTQGFGERQDMEFYRPTYFFKTARPTLQAVTRLDGPDDEIAYGGQFFIETPQASSISRVALMRPGSVTHHTDTEQRYVPLSFTRLSDTMLRVGVVADPTVAPPGYYMLWIVDNQGMPCQKAEFIQLTRRHCRVVTDRSHVSNDEVNPAGSTEFTNSFYVIMDGFVPSDLGITAANPTQAQLDAWAPDIDFTSGSGEFAAAVADLVAVPEELLLEDDTLPAGIRQKCTFKYKLVFSSNASFLDDADAPIELQTINLTATKGDYSCRENLTLTNQPNPYMLDGATHWLSTDVRVFQISEGDTRFGRTIGASSAAATSFIKQVLNDFNADPAQGASSFATISTDQATSKLELARSKGGKRVFNFAVAKVSYRGRTLEAADVSVFFRMFTTAATGLDFRSGSTYRTRTNSVGDPIPVLGVRGGEVVTIPFFAESRVNTAVVAMDTQEDPTNQRTIAATGGATSNTFFGCWLDINQTALRFPTSPGGIGPFSSGMKSIQELIRGRHQCLVAEINFASDPISEGQTPAENDNLSQRNLAIVESDNPGSDATHTVSHTFEIAASEAVGLGTPAVALEYQALELHAADHALVSKDLVRAEHDELMFQWGTLPRSSRATLYIPDIRAEDIHYLTSLNIGPERVAIVDDHTVELLVSDVTYVTLPPAPTNSIPALLTIELPEHVKRGQQFNVTISQIDGLARKVLGAFEFVVPVTDRQSVLEEEERTLSVFKFINEAIPVTDHWKPIFGKRIGQLSDRVDGLGGDAAAVEASPDGDGGAAPGTIQGGFGVSACRTLAVLVAVLLSLFVAAAGSTAWLLAAVALITLAVVAYLWFSRCVVTFDLAIRIALLGLVLGAVLLLST